MTRFKFVLPWVSGFAELFLLKTLFMLIFRRVISRNGLSILRRRIRSVMIRVGPVSGVWRGRTNRLLLSIIVTRRIRLVMRRASHHWVKWWQTRRKLFPWGVLLLVVLRRVVRRPPKFLNLHVVVRLMAFAVTQTDVDSRIRTPRPVFRLTVTLSRSTLITTLVKVTF